MMCMECAAVLTPAHMCELAFPGRFTLLILGSCQGLDSAHFLPTAPTQKLGDVGVPGNNGPPNPSGPLREKEAYLPVQQTTAPLTPAPRKPGDPYAVQEEGLSFFVHSVPTTWSAFPHPLSQRHP